MVLAQEVLALFFFLQNFKMKKIFLEEPITGKLFP